MKKQTEKLYYGIGYLGIIDLMLGDKLGVSTSGILTEYSSQGTIWIVEGFSSEYQISGIWFLDTLL